MKNLQISFKKGNLKYNISQVNNIEEESLEKSFAELIAKVIAESDNLKPVLVIEQLKRIFDI